VVVSFRERRRKYFLLIIGTTLFETNIEIKRNKAMKYINSGFLTKEYIEALKGMPLPRPINLHQGQVIYRFYDSKNPQLAINGAWWFEYEYFQKIKQFALQHGYSFSYAVRLFAAILYEWSEVDSFVRCEVKHPLKALKGRGKL
jgi:hypothetical protein